MSRRFCRVTLTYRDVQLETVLVTVETDVRTFSSSVMLTTFADELHRLDPFQTARRIA